MWSSVVDRQHGCSRLSCLPTSKCLLTNTDHVSHYHYYGLLSTTIFCSCFRAWTTKLKITLASPVLEHGMTRFSVSSDDEPSDTSSYCSDDENKDNEDQVPLEEFATDEYFAVTLKLLQLPPAERSREHVRNHVNLVGFVNWKACEDSQRPPWTGLSLRWSVYSSWSGTTNFFRSLMLRCLWSYAGTWLTPLWRQTGCYFTKAIQESGVCWLQSSSKGIVCQAGLEFGEHLVRTTPASALHAKNI